MATGVLADEIRHKLGELSPAERKVGRVLLAAYPSAGFETVAAIAERAQVSAPTVLRFVSRFGFRGFPDFQAALRAELQERNASPLSLYDAPAYGRPVEEGTDQGSLLDRAGRIFPSEVAKTLAELPPHDLDHAVRLLADARLRVTLAGGRFTHLLAQYLGLHLMQLREDVRFLPDRSVERTAALASLGRRDLLVLFDYRRYEADKVAMAELARARGGKVLLFTDAWLSPVTGRADVTLPCRVTAPSPYDSLVPTLAVIETVVAAVVEALGEAAHDHLRRAEDIAQNIGLV
ncbi:MULTISPECIES: MurR/RpiR family transcriptional regulator [unclassified Streptomyces]|uniref:MurR/RpiR family transcriptional regulator n=1 Tax=unclassified Streptomyces TaxID=2593676 RepID=UPI0004BFFFBA|nr:MULTISPECIES: MurR/RpiR family transcriptional regulator [unclassified Streptomyces]